MDPRFIHRHKTSKKVRSITLQQRQTIESSTRCCFWSTVSKRGTHRADSFFISKRSCKMYLARSFEMPTASANSRNFTLRSLKTIRCTCFTISAFVASFGLPERGASLACTTHFKFTKPLINCCSRRSRCGITFLQPFQWLFRSFSHQNTMFDQDAIFLFFHFFFYEGESSVT